MQDLPVNVLDLVVISVLLLSGILAFFRGFVHEVLAITAWIGAALAALYGLPYAQPYLRDLIPITWAADAAGAIGIFLVVLLVLSLLTRALSKRVQESALNNLDRALGFLFGLARGGLFITIAFIFMNWLIPPQDQPDWMRDAKSMPLIQQAANLVESMIPDELKGQANEAAETVSEETRKAIDTKKMLDKLTQPEPTAPEKDPNSEPGYEEGSRNDMNQLFRSNQ